MPVYDPSFNFPNRERLESHFFRQSFFVCHARKGNSVSAGGTQCLLYNPPIASEKTDPTTDVPSTNNGMANRT